MRLAGAFAGAGAIALALWTGMGISDPETAPALEEAALAGSTYEGPVLKAAKGTDVLRAKAAEGAVVPDLDDLTTGPDVLDVFLAQGVVA